MPHKSLATERGRAVLSSTEVLFLLQKTPLSAWKQECNHRDIKKLHYVCSDGEYEYRLSFKRVGIGDDDGMLTISQDGEIVSYPSSDTFIQVEVLALIVKLQAERNKLQNLVHEFVTQPQMVLLYRDSFKCLASPLSADLSKITLKIHCDCIHFDEPILIHFTISLQQRLKAGDVTKLYGLRVEAHSAQHHSDVVTLAPGLNMRLRQLYRYLESSCLTVL